MKNTKLIFSFLLVAALFTGINAQDKGNCYLDYLTMFKERGAKPVTDGVQNVVVTSRSSDGTTCTSMVGTIEVKGGKIIGNLLLKAMDGTMVKPNDKLNEKYNTPEQSSKADFKIKNGMSATFLTQKKEAVNLFFIDFLKEKPAALQEAPKAK